MITRENALETIKEWPEQSREAARLVIDQHGEPDEASASRLVWHDVGPWKQMVAQRTFWKHRFPAPHIDCVESFLDYRVPTDKFSALAEFDGSVIAERTSGLVSARCHDEQANFLALNLMHDIVTGERSVEDARNYYSKEFLDFRRNQPTPYMEGLRFEPASNTADPDERMLSDEQLEQARDEGRKGA